MKTTRYLFGPPANRTLESCACGGRCSGRCGGQCSGAGCRSGFGYVIDSSIIKSGAKVDAGLIIVDAIATMLNPGSSVIKGFTDLMGGTKTAAAQEGAERLAVVQAQTNVAQAQARAQSSANWADAATRFAPWVVLGVGGVVAAMVLLKAKK